MKIFTDVDGVLVEFCDTYLEVLYKTSGIKKTYSDITHFNFSKCVATPEQDKAVWDYIDNNPGTVYNVPFIQGALAGLQELRKYGQVVALTSPHLGPTWHHERTHVLIDKCGFTKKEVIFCSDKKLVPGDVLIEDSLENAQDYIKEHPKSTVILLDCPYNQGKISGITRVKDWEEVVDVVKVTYKQRFR